MITNRRNNFRIYENEKISMSEVRKLGLMGICYSKNNISYNKYLV